MKWDMPGRISKKYLSQTSEASLFVPAGKFSYKRRPKKPKISKQKPPFFFQEKIYTTSKILKILENFEKI